MKVEQVMTHTVRTCHPGDTLADAARIMWEQDCGCVPVIVEGDGEPQVVAMITDRDVCMGAYTQGRALEDISVRTAMSRSLSTVGRQEPIDVAMKIFETNRLRRLPVVDERGRLVGMLSLCDVVREVTRERSQAHPDVRPEQVASALEVVVASRTGGQLMSTAA